MKAIYVSNILLILLLSTGFLTAQQRTEMPSPINRPESIGLTPCISLDGRTIIFATNKDGIWKIVESNLQDDNSWTEPKSIEAINKYSGPRILFGSSSLSFDGNTLYFCANFNGNKAEPEINSLGDEDIYYSERNGDTWSKPVNLGPPVNTKEYDATPSISADGKTLYFVRSNKNSKTEGFQCKKIYYSEKDSVGKWKAPVPLPVTINLDCEQSPRICSDSRTLIFSSVRGGKNNADLYYSKMIAKNIWTDPVAMDFANTEYADQYASIVAKGDNIYYSVKGEIGGKIFGKIYSMYLPEEYRPFKSIVLQGKIFDFYTKQPVSAYVRISDANTTNLIYEQKNNTVDGRYTIVLTEGRKYTVEYYRDSSYSHFVAQYDLQNLKKSDYIPVDVPLYPRTSLNINVFDSELLEPITSDIVVRNITTNKAVTPKQSELAKGRYLLEMPIGEKYLISVSGKKFEPYEFKFDLTSMIMFDQFMRNIELKPKKKEYVINLADMTTEKGVNGEIIITNKERNEKYVVKPDENGKYVIKLREGEKYDVAISPKGYSFYNTTLDLSNDTVEAKINVKLVPLTESTRLQLKNINFETNSAELNVGSYVELDRVVGLMKVNPQIKVEISAHTDNVGDAAYNLKLSLKRAQSAVNYMVEKGIEIKQVIAKGYGKTLPVAPNDNDANRAKNRRVELKIIEVNN